MQVARHAFDLGAPRERVRVDAESTTDCAVRLQRAAQNTTIRACNMSYGAGAEAGLTTDNDAGCRAVHRPRARARRPTPTPPLTSAPQESHINAHCWGDRSDGHASARVITNSRGASSRARDGQGSCAEAKRVRLGVRPSSGHCGIPPACDSAALPVIPAALGRARRVGRPRLAIKSGSGTADDAQAGSRAEQHPLLRTTDSSASPASDNKVQTACLPNARRYARTRSAASRCV